MPPPTKMMDTKFVLTDSPPLPKWLQERVGGSLARRMSGSAPDLNLSTFECPGHRLVRARVIGAAGMSVGEFQRATIAAYGDIAAQLASAPSRHAVRMWNYLPDIHQPCGDELDRYMVFNAARFEACQSWLGNGSGRTHFQQHLPTASGVGHRGRDLVIDALGMDVKGIPIENPRQTPAYQYSRAFGPKPPCFARAMKIPESNGGYTLFVGGTASIRGELTVHESDLQSQMDETLENLSSLIRAAGDCAGNELDGFQELRIYHPRRQNSDAIIAMARRRFPAAARIECVIANLCRKELLVEIEGLVTGNIT
jgi:enamine deaminase RidA (YjgF/YER057c/UK114 family)